MVPRVAEEDAGKAGNQHDRRDDHGGAYAGKGPANRFVWCADQLIFFLIASQEMDRVVDCDSKANCQGANRHNLQRLANPDEINPSYRQGECVGKNGDDANAETAIGHPQDNKDDDERRSQAGQQVDHDLVKILPSPDRRSLELGFKGRVLLLQLFKPGLDPLEYSSISGNSQVLYPKRGAGSMVFWREIAPLEIRWKQLRQ